MPAEVCLLKVKLRSSILCTAAAAKSLQLCPALCDSIDGSPPGSPVLGILQARTLEWVESGLWPIVNRNSSKGPLFSLDHSIILGSPGRVFHSDTEKTDCPLFAFFPSF